MSPQPIAPPVAPEGLQAVELGVALRRALHGAVAETVWTDWFGTCIALGFDDPLAAASYRRRYARFATERAADIRAYALRHDGRTLFWVEGGPAYEWREALQDPLALEFLADAVVRHAYFMEHSPYLSFHAAALAAGGSAFAVTAASGGGKTTTALACARRGMPLYSDERCVIDGECVLPFPRALNVRSAALELLAADLALPDGGLGERLRRQLGGDWNGVDFAELFDDAPLPSPQPLRAIFFVTGRGATPAVRPMALREALPALLAVPLRGRSRGLERVADATRLLSRVQAYALTLGRPDATARLLREAAG
jgi:hypothetical protein